MTIEFSKHALVQMKLRGISIAIVSMVLANPGQIIVDNGKTLYQSIVLEESTSYLIRIFVNNQKTPNVVITAYKTSKISKYYEGEI